MSEQDAVPLGSRIECKPSRRRPNRNGKAAIPISLQIGFPGSGKTVLDHPRLIDVQSWLDADSCTPLDRRNSDGRGRGKENVSQDPGLRRGVTYRRKRIIRTYRHSLEHPITADDLCTWLDLLMDFAGTDLLRLKAVVGVAGWPGPVLLHGVGRVLHPPVTLSQWPSGDHRTRIELITRNLNEGCLREFLAILTAAVSGRGRSKTPALQPHPDRAAG